MINQRERTVVTVILNNKPYVFGSLASIFDYFKDVDLGINYNVLRTKMGKNKDYYENNICSITRSKLITKAMIKSKYNEE